MRSLLFWLALLGVFGCGGYVIAQGPLNKWFQFGAAPRFRTAPVTRGRIESTVNSTGTIKPVRSVSVGAFISGPIAEIYVDFNSVVKKGELMARIDPRLTQAEVDRASAALATQKAELARVEALLQQAKNNEDRARKLRQVNKDYISEFELDQLQYTRESQEAMRNVALAAIEQATAALKNAQTNLEFTQITSPVDGIVIERKVDPGQTMASAFQTPEMFIVAPDMDKHMYVFASVDEADIGQIRAAKEKGRRVTFTVDAYPEELFVGKIYQIRANSTTTQNVVTYPVVIEAANPDLKLMPGMTANISFQIEEKEDILRIPTAALRFFPTVTQVRPEDRIYLEGLVQTGGNGADSSNNPRPSAADKVTLARNRLRRVLWIQDGEKLRAVPVVLGMSDSQHAELVEGDLTEGQLVVTGIDTSPVTAAK